MNMPTIVCNGHFGVASRPIMSFKDLNPHTGRRAGYFLWLSQREAVKPAVKLRTNSTKQQLDNERSGSIITP